MAKKIIMFVFYFVSIIIFVIVLVLGLGALAMLISVFVGVPFVPTHQRQAGHMMELAEIKPGDQVIDLGSGAGRLLFLAAGRGATAIGYELNPLLCWWTRLMVIFKRLSGRVLVKCQSLYQADLKKADVVLAFLFPEPMKRLGPKLFSELRPGAKIVSYAFSIPGHEPVTKQDGIYVYKV